MTLDISPTFTWNETVWNPLMLGPALWLDAADASTITLNGSTVSQWSDKSGNSRHVIQATAGAQPLYSANQIGGLPALSFDGGDFLRTALSFPLGLQFSAFGVVKPEAGTGWNNNDYGYVFAHGSLSSSTKGAALVIGSESFADWFVRDTIAFGDGYNSGRMPRAIGPVSTGTDARVFSLSLGTTESFMAVNGTLTSTRVSGTGTRTNLIAPLTLGANANASANQWLTGKIAEFLVVSNTVSLSNRQKLEGYLTHKWGLDASLPADHPYKNYGPRP